MTKKLDPQETQELRDLISRMGDVLEGIRTRLASASAHDYIVQPADNSDQAVMEAVARPQLALDRAREAAMHASGRLIDVRAHLAVLHGAVEKLTRG